MLVFRLALLRNRLLGGGFFLLVLACYKLNLQSTFLYLKSVPQLRIASESIQLTASTRSTGAQIVRWGSEAAAFIRIAVATKLRLQTLYWSVLCRIPWAFRLLSAELMKATSPSAYVKSLAEIEKATLGDLLKNTST
ncbi:MAG: hypothetical protein CFE44_13275 [Burkholderiales bacterium PBB4]|nr:MAG: hypothetical protein CFE44_13275 [Burkholderiales bacterium PBB4]